MRIEQYVDNSTLTQGAIASRRLSQRVQHPSDLTIGEMHAGPVQIVQRLNIVIVVQRQIIDAFDHWFKTMGIAFTEGDLAKQSVHCER